MVAPPRRFLVLLVVGSTLAAAPTARPAYAAPDARLWPRWLVHDPASAARIDHSAWDRLLEAHVRRGPDGVNRVAYAAVTADDRGALASYIASLESTPVSHRNRDEQLAFWMNLYNAATLRTVLEHYPVRSIRDIDISPGLFANGPWGKDLITVEGVSLSLDDVEHRILRPIWRDPRIHYGVNCAAVGCPDLLRTAFTGDNVDDLLDAAGRAFVNHRRGVRIDGDELTVSSIYVWFKDDFGGTEAGVLRHLRDYAEPELAGRLGHFTRIHDYRYDWTLNDARECNEAAARAR